MRDVGVVEGDLPGREDRVVDVLLLHRGNHDSGVRYLAGREPDLPGRGSGALGVHRVLAVAPAATVAITPAIARTYGLRDMLEDILPLTGRPAFP